MTDLAPRAFARLDGVRIPLRIKPIALTPWMVAVAFGAMVGLTAGCAYLGGSVARQATLQGQASRLEGVAAAGFTEEALAAAAGGLDESALSIARRHDRFTVAGGAERDRQASLIAARLETLRAEGGLRHARLDAVPGVQPFRLASSIDASRDLDCLTQAVYYEARGEGSDGMKAVAQVVLNRARHPAFPKSVCGVVFQGSNRSTGCQFSFTCNGAMRGGVNRAAWDRARRIADAAMSGAVYGPVGTATHFHTTAVSPNWAGLVRIGQVGQHVFYRFGGRNGGSDRFRFTPRGSTGGPATTSPDAGLMTASAKAPAAGAVAYTALVAAEAPASTATAAPEAPTTARPYTEVAEAATPTA